ncbi:alpha/beta hydrolase [Lacticaseibacillus paracasei]|uniref:alpha/beta hydrolase n=1 Tax=Lacticaseibacillus paracasei TaxID=1597 RepID=UPI0031D88A79
MRKHKKAWLIGLLSIFGVLLMGLVGASLYFYQYAFVPSKKSFLSGGESRIVKDGKAWLKTVHKETWTEKAAGADLKLVADYVPAAKPTNKTVVVAHGYMNTKEFMAPQIKMFHDAGFNVLASDDRGHGQSQGNYIGCGWPDRLDYLKWINQIIKKQGQQSQIALYGVSMGGATVMYLSGEKLPSQVKSIVEDCGYTSIIDELTYQAKAMFNLPKWPLIPSVALTATIKAGYNVFDASAITALHKNTRPILFIHGSKDKFVPTSMVYQNYRAATKSKKALWVVKGAGHAKSFPDHQQAYSKRVVGWFNANW